MASSVSPSMSTARSRCEKWFDVDGDPSGTWTAEKAWQGASDVGNGPRRYQTRVTHGDRSWVLFAPSGTYRTYFRNYCHRINASGYRPSGLFPGDSALRWADLRGADLRGADLRGADLRGADLRGA